MIKCIIVDDEPLAFELLADYAVKVPFLSLIACCDSVSQAIKIIAEKEPALIFLDINMPDINGLQLIKGLQNPPAIIITTAHPQYAVDGFELNVNDFLLKPISFERFLKAVNRVKDSLQHFYLNIDVTKRSHEYLFIKTDYKLVKLDLEDIKYLEGLKDYVKVITKNKTYVTRQSLKFFEEKLQGTDFFRVHRSYIVSIRHISAVTKNRIIIDTNYIPISEHYQDAFFELIRNSF